MRVAYLLRYYPTVSETFIYGEIAGLVARGHQVEILALGRRADGAVQTALPTVPVHRVPRRPLTGRLRPATTGMQWLSAFQRPKDVARLPWLAQRLAGFDRVHAHFAGEAAELAHAIHLDGGPPYSVTVHASDLFRPRPSLSTVLQGARPAITIASIHAALLSKQGIEAQVVRCGPDLSLFRPHPLPGGPLRAIAVGRAVPKKGLDLLLDAWQGVEGTLTLVSDWSGPVPDGVRITGLLSSAEVRDHLADSNLFVLPCRRAPDGDMDGLPVALMEAMAMARPVVTTSASAIPELVDDEVGWLISPDDPSALHAALLEATDEGERQRRGQRGPRRLKDREHTLEHQVEGLIAAWQSHL